jgi:hypothetical protein
LVLANILLPLSTPLNGHCAPTDMQVFQHDAFFTAPDQPPPRYGYKKHGDRLYAVSGPPAFQK